MLPRFTLAVLAMVLLAPFIGTEAAPGRAPAQNSQRMETTQAPQSAPLGLINRSFARVQSAFAIQLESQRLSYRSLNPQDHSGSEVAKERAIEDLLLNISGGSSEARVQDLAPIIAGESSLKPTFERFARELTSSRSIDTSAGADSLTALVAAIKAALSRSDVQLHSARLIEKSATARVLILSDDETKEFVVLSLPGR